VQDFGSAAVRSGSKPEYLTNARMSASTGCGHAVAYALGSFVPILLQKSQIAWRQFLAVKKIRPTTADRCVPNHVTEVANEFIFRQ
jgi:hypothetical protein